MGPQVGSSVGRYRLERVLGAGGMGVVYAATDTRLQRPVAVKVMSVALAGSPEFRARFDREAAILARLDSPHAVGIHDHGEHPADGGGAPYLVTRLVPGGDLGSLLRERGPLPGHLAARVAAQVAEALRDAHAAGVVHRDVKPANVLLRDPDEPELFAYLCDFGIATSGGSGLTATGAGVSGTWSYLSPERIDGGPGTPASDLYALGCLLWTTLTGRPPYTGTDFAVADAHHRAPVPQLPGTDDLSVGLNRFLASAMAKDPAARPADAEAARAHLLALAAGRPPGPLRTGATTSGTGTPPGRRRRGAVLAGAAALLLVAGGTTAAVLWPAGDPDGDTAPVADASSRPVTGDLDSDGLGDFLMQPGRTDDASRFTWTSDGESFGDPVEQPGARGLPLRGDVDGDRRTDVVTVSRGTAGAGVRVELGDGEVVASTRAGTGLELVNSLVGDVDGDGLDDLAVWGPDAVDCRYRFAVFPSRGDGRFAPPVELALPDLTAGYLQPGDYDGDGRLDLAHVDSRPGRASGEETATVQLLLQADDGFAALSPPAASDGTPGVTFTRSGDLDGDGDDELVESTVTSTERLVRVWDVADGKAGSRVWFRAATPPGGFTTFVPTVGDYDGDGRDDLLYWRSVSDVGDYALDVMASDGSSYEAPREWGRWSCGDDCGEPVTMLDTAI